MQRGGQAYFYNTGRRIVQGVFWVSGRRIYRRLCGFDEAHIAPDGTLLKDWSAKRRDAFLAPLWLAMEAALGEGEEPRARKRLGVLWQAFLDVAAADRAAGTVLLYKAARKDYLAANRDHALADFSLHHVDRFKLHLKAQKLSPHTVNQRLVCLRAFLRWAYDRGELARLPRFPNVPAPKKQPAILTGEEYRALMAYLVRHMRTGRRDRRWLFRLHFRFLILAMGSGLRRGEIHSLRWEQLDLNAGTVQVRISGQFRTKENREKLVPLAPFALKFLRLERAAHPAETWLLDTGKNTPAYQDRHSITTAFRRHLKAIGAHGKAIKPTHSQRAFYATALRAAGTDAYTIQQLMGHSDIKVTEGYFSGPDENKRAAAARLMLPRANRGANKDEKGRLLN